MIRCTGEGGLTETRGRDHCCYQGGERCPHLRENTAGRRYACGLLVDHGSWEAVNRSVGYEPIGRYWESIGQPFNYCETFDPGFCCRPEHRHGRNNQNDPIPEAVTCCGDVG